MLKGKVINIRPILMDKKLKVAAKIETEKWGIVDAFLPQREIAALLPRSILIGKETKVSRKILHLVNSILSRSVKGRVAKIWDFEGNKYFSFLSWKSVHFKEE